MKRIFSLLSAFAMLFLTEGQTSVTWSTPPVTLSSTGVDSSSPQVGVDGSGNAVAIWIENGAIKASNYSAMSGMWSLPGTPISTMSVTASAPQLVVDTSGNATAVWLESGIVQSNTQASGGGWAGIVSLTSSGTSTSPALAVDTSGNVVAIWSNGTLIQSVTKLAAGTFPVSPSPSTVYTGTAPALPEVAIGASGTVVAVFSDVVSSFSNIYAANTTIGGAWSGSATAISTASTNNSNPQVAVDSSGNAIAVWYGYTLRGSVYSNVVLQGAYRPNGFSWVGLGQVSLPGYMNPAQLQSRIAFDGNGTAVAVWSNSTDGATFWVSSANYFPKTSTISHAGILGNNLYIYALDLINNSAGDVVAVYMQLDDSSNVVVGSAEANFESFGFPSWFFFQEISQGSPNGFPMIAGNMQSNTFNVATVWENNNGSNNIIQASIGSMPVLQAPTITSVTQSNNSFGIFTEYYNVVQWTTSPSMGVAGYAIYRNGTLLGTVGPSTTQWIDDNQPISSSLPMSAYTYQVFAYDANYFYSVASKMTFP